MDLQGRLLIDEFVKQYPHSRSPLDKWAQETKKALWKNFPEIRQTFPSADYVAPFIVFNIGGNKFRLIALVIFKKGIVRVEQVLTHAQYDRWNP